MSPDLLAGRYELTDRIAGGGMGQVWRGLDRVLERIVAVKTVDLSTQDATMRERFRREAVATAGLSAPNIVQVFDAGADETTAYLVMELLTGPSVSQIVHDQGRLEIGQSIHVAREVALALLTAHRIGVVHRDIKPGNVMYHHDQVKLVDFGIAQLQRNMGAALTAPATALGTAAYMSPEQAAGEGATEKSDWYALGCLMTTMVTGQPPFQGEAVAVATQQITAKPPSLSERRPEVPAALDTLVAAMMAKEPGDRPTGEQVVKQLRLLEADPTAGTILLPGQPGGTNPAPTDLMGSTAVMPPTGAAAGTGRVTLGKTPNESGEPVRPVAAPPPRETHGEGGAIRPADRRTQRRPAWPWMLLVVALLGLGIGAGYLLVNDPGPENGPGPIAATPTPTARPTSEPPTATRAPTTTRRPATTRPPTTTRTTTTPPRTTSPPTTTQPPTTQPPTTQPPTTRPPATQQPTQEQRQNEGGGTSGESAAGDDSPSAEESGPRDDSTGADESESTAAPDESATDEVGSQTARAALAVCPFPRLPGLDVTSQHVDGLESDLGAEEWWAAFDTVIPGQAPAAQGRRPERCGLVPGP